MIETIAANAKGMENDAVRSKPDAQTAHEIFVKESDTGIAAKTQDIVNKRERKPTEREFVVKHVRKPPEYSGMFFGVRPRSHKETKVSSEVEAKRNQAHACQRRP